MMIIGSLFGQLELWVSSYELCKLRHGISSSISNEGAGKTILVVCGSALSTHNTSNTMYHQLARRRKGDGVQSVCPSYDTVYHQLAIILA
jgi:hypothetical protein